MKTHWLSGGMIDTYVMEYICRNCGNNYRKAIDKGTDAKGEGGECPYCGKEDRYYFPFDYRMPLGDSE